MCEKRSKVWMHIASFSRDRQGAIAVIVALLLPILAGVLALAIDLSRAANLQTELQDHADAAALAGATQLDQSAGSRERAIQAAAGAVALAVNSQRFGDDTEALGEGGIAVDSTVSVPADGVAVNNDIKFYVDLETKTQATSDAEANFIEVNIQPHEISYFFAGLVSQVTEAYPKARAIAGNNEFICGIKPMMICNPSGGANFDVNANIGHGLFLKVPEGKTSDFIDGEFGFLEVGGTKKNSEVCNALGSVNPADICLGQDLNGKPGDLTSFAPCINARFNIYHDTGLTNGWSNNPEFQPDVNVVKGLIHDGSSACNYNPVAGGPGGPSAWERPEQVSQPHYEGQGSLTVGELDLLTTMSYPRDNCAYNEGGCDLNASDPDTQTQVGDGDWDIGAYAYVQHKNDLGVAVGSPLASYGDALEALAGAYVGKAAGAHVTRKDVYDWEVGAGAVLAHPPTSLDHNPYVPGGLCWSGGAGSLPQATGSYTSGSRRVITVAVIDCDASAPSKKDLVEANPGAIEIFLLEPIGGYTPNDIYAEIIGEAANQDVTVTKTNRIVLYE